MKYKIGDRVIVREWEDMPESFRISNDGVHMTARGKCCGKHCQIIDVLESATEGTLYRLSADEGYVSHVLYKEEWLIAEPKKNIVFDYRYDAETCRLYLTVRYGKDEIESAYGFVKTEDIEGFVNAFSFAAFTLNNKFRYKNKKGE